MAAGDVVNTGARLQAAAPVNGILVSQRTFRRRRTRSISACWNQSRRRARRGRPRVGGGLRGARSGLRDVITRHHWSVGLVSSTSSPQSSTAPASSSSRSSSRSSACPASGSRGSYTRFATGPDGAGVRWLHGRCLPYGDGVTISGARRDRPSAARRRRIGSVEVLDTRLDEAVERGVDQGSSATVLGLETGRRHRRRSWSRGVRGVADVLREVAAVEGPLGLVVEDMHWADDVLLDFVDQLVDWAGGVALFVVCYDSAGASRGRRSWGGGKDKPRPRSRSRRSRTRRRPTLGVCSGGP